MEFRVSFCPDHYRIKTHWLLFPSGCRIAQVRLIFQILDTAILQIFPSPTLQVPSHLAYIEWFNPIPPIPDRNHGMYRVSRSLIRGHRQASIISVDDIISSIHLFPRFTTLSSPPEDLSPFSVLEQCHSFYINPFSNRDNYLQFSWIFFLIYYVKYSNTYGVDPSKQAFVWCPIHIQHPMYSKECL